MKIIGRRTVPEFLPPEEMRAAVGPRRHAHVLRYPDTRRAKRQQRPHRQMVILEEEQVRARLPGGNTLLIFVLVW